jgi:hypothetical protein
MVQLGVLSFALKAQPLLNVDFGTGTTSPKLGFAATGRSSNDFWNLYSRDDGSGGYRVFGTVNNLKWSDGTASAVGLSITNAPGAWINGAADPMFSVYLYPATSGGIITLTVTNLPVGNYDFYLYGHGGPNADNQNSVFQVVSGNTDYGTKATTTTSGWSSPIWQEGQQYVVFRDVSVANPGGNLTITVLPGASPQASLSGIQILQKSPSQPVGPFVNGSFESPAFSTGGHALSSGSTSVTGWITGGPGTVAIVNGPAAGVVTVDGAQQMEFGSGDTVAGATLSQTFVTTIGHIYAVSFYAGRVGPGSGTMSLQAQVTSSIGAVLTSLTVVAPDTQGYGQVQTFTFTATTVSSTLTFTDTSTATLAVDVLLDNVRVESGTGSCVQLPSGLVGWWLGDGNADDFLGANNGTVTGGLSFTNGNVGPAFTFNGIDSQISFGNTVGNFDTNDFTVEFWIRTTATRLESVIEKWPTCGYSSMWEIRIGGASGPGRLNAVTESDTAGNDVNAISAGRAINDGLFHHVAFVRRGTNLVFYIDGVLDVASSASSGTVSRINNTANLTAGKGVCVGIDGTSPLTGQLDEITLYNRALSASEIQGIYQAGSAGKCQLTSPGCVTPASGLVGWWKGNGNASDAVGNLQGTLVGNATFASGLVAQAFSFDGANDGVSFGNPASLQIQNFTIEAWIKRFDTNRTSFDVFSGTVLGYGYGGYDFDVKDDGRLSLGKVGIVDVNSSPKINDTNWHHVAVTKLANNVVLYVDGVGETMPPFDPGFTFASDVQIGAIQWDSTQPRGSFLGLIDEVAVYSRALSGVEIGSIFAAGAAGKCPPASVTINPNGGVFTNNVSITLTASGGAMLVYYTLDGSDPTTNAVVYTAPFELTNSATVKAAIFEGGTRVSDVVSALFVVQHSSGSCVFLPGLIGWWKGEGNGSDVVGSNQGTLLGDATFAPGLVGQAFSFDGANDGVSFGNPASLQLQKFTIEAWVKRHDTNVASLDIFGAGAVLGYGYYGYTFVVRDNGRLSLGRVGISGIDSTATVKDTNWHHVAVTKSGSTIGFYVDGVGETGSAYDPGFTFSSDVQIGAIEWDSTQPRATFLGLIDEVAIYNRALSASDVQSIYNAGAVGKCTPVSISISPSGGFFTNSIAVSITSSGSNDVIYYTLDGTVPSTNSVAYSDPFILTNSAAVTARVIENGNPISDTVCSGYRLLGGSVACVAPAGAISWWTGDCTSEDVLGLSRGLIAGNATFEAGLINQAFAFGGEGDAITVLNSPSLQLQTFTIEAWVKRKSTNQATLGTTGGGAIFAYGSGGYGFSLFDDGRLSLTKVGLSYVTSTASVTDTNWHHVAVTRSGTLVSFYVDGVGRGTTNYNATFTFTANAAIGATGDSLVASFYGLIDEPAIYGRALSTNEIRSLFDAGANGKCPTFAPIIIASPQNRTVPIGGNTSFSVTAGGSPQLNYQWSFNGTPILNATNAVLAITSVQATNAGTYAVTVSNAFAPSASTSATLAISLPPSITQQPKSQTVLAGSAATLTVGVAGTSPFSYVWRRNGFLISGAAGPTLVINNVQAANAGTYIVRVSNSLGATNSAPATLTVASGQFSPVTVSTNGVQLTVQGEVGATYTVLVSSDLIHWDPLATLLNNPQNWQFTDTSATGVNIRFYRLQKSP